MNWRVIRAEWNYALLGYFWPLGVRRVRTAQIIIGAVAGLDLAGVLTLLAIYGL